LAYKIFCAGRSEAWYRGWFGTSRSQVQILPPRPKIMRKAKIYKPTKSAMQSGRRNSKNWVLEFDTLNNGINPLMGWETSKDTMSEVKLLFSTKDQAITYAKKNKLDFYIVEPKKNKIIKKSYADNFLK
tara:strand:- start:236 stop:622 length:387 start_codon:yes stop_codon:yes gene_type:complete